MSYQATQTCQSRPRQRGERQRAMRYEKPSCASPSQSSRRCHAASPGYSSTNSRSDMPSDAPGDRILRVIGIAGDTVTCCDPQGRILLNGIALDESYLPAGTATDQRDFTVVVPADSVFVLGDDRETAVDSRSYLDLNGGAVALTKVRARVLFVLWPLDRVGWISTPSAFNQAGAPANP